MPDQPGKNEALSALAFAAKCTFNLKSVLGKPKTFVDLLFAVTWIAELI